MTAATARTGVARRSRLGERDARRKGGTLGGLGGEHRSLSPARELALSPRPGPPPCSHSPSLLLSLSIAPPRRPFRFSLATILYVAAIFLPRIPPPTAYSAPRGFSCSLSFHRAFLFFMFQRSIALTSYILQSLSPSFAANWDLEQPSPTAATDA